MLKYCAEYRKRKEGVGNTMTVDVAVGRSLDALTLCATRRVTRFRASTRLAHGSWIVKPPHTLQLNPLQRFQHCSG
jgi:hypothetical protein